MANLNNLINIPGYNAGKEGNLLVSLDTDLCIRLNSTVEKSAVKLYIAGARITSEEAVKNFEELVDDETPCNKVIVVSDKFMRLSQKKQLALLQYENIKLQERGEVHLFDEYPEVAAEVLVRKNNGRMTCRVLEKAHRYKNNQVKKASKVLAKQDKKDAKQEQKLAKANEKAAKKAAKAAAKAGATPAAEQQPEGEPA